MPLPKAATTKTTVTFFKHPEEGTSTMAKNISPAEEEQRLFLAQLAERHFKERHRQFQTGLKELLAAQSGQFKPRMVRDAWVKFCEEVHGGIDHVDILCVAATIASLYNYLSEVIIATQSQALQSAEPLSEDSDPNKVYAPIDVGDPTINSFLYVLRNSFHEEGVSYPNLKLPFCIAEILAYLIGTKLTEKIQSISIYAIGYPAILTNIDITNHLTELLELVKKAGSARAMSQAGQLFIDLLGSVKSQPDFIALRDHFEQEYKASDAVEQLGAHARFGWLYFLTSYLICAALARSQFKNDEQFEAQFDFSTTRARFEEEWAILSQAKHRYSPVCWPEKVEAQYQQYVQSDLRQVIDHCYYNQSGQYSPALSL